MTSLPPASTLAPTQQVDSDHPAVREFAHTCARGATERERAVALYYAVRDKVRYDPYRVDLSPLGMRASTALTSGIGWCIPKAALLAAVYRASGIPARLGYADVCNHLSTARMRDTMRSDLYIWHGYTDVWLDGAWRKATPAFNIELCNRFGLLPLEFDGVNDSIYHPYDRAGNRHMEYVNQRGAFDEMPLARIVADFEVAYPFWLAHLKAMHEANFLADVEREQA